MVREASSRRTAFRVGGILPGRGRRRRLYLKCVSSGSRLPAQQLPRRISFNGDAEDFGGAFFLDVVGATPFVSEHAHDVPVDGVRPEGTPPPRKRPRAADLPRGHELDGASPHRVSDHLADTACHGGSGLASSSRCGVAFEPELTEEPVEARELSTLERYLVDTQPAERLKRQRAKAENLRYYVAGDGQGTALVASARTDDGYLTRAGTQVACIVCCKSGHKPWDCPELRCYLCFFTGHPGKSCPRAWSTCESCGKRGHAPEACLWQAMVDAARSKRWTSVRCVRCGTVGHPMCVPEQESRLEAEERGDRLRAAARSAVAMKVSAVLTGRKIARAGSMVYSAASPSSPLSRGQGDLTEKPKVANTSWSQRRANNSGSTDGWSAKSWGNALRRNESWACRKHSGAGAQKLHTQVGRWPRGHHDEWRNIHNGRAHLGMAPDDVHRRLLAKLAKQNGRSGWQAWDGGDLKPNGKGMRRSEPRWGQSM